MMKSSDFQVVELRRYLMHEGQRENFAAYFDSYFPEAFQQLGAIAFGQFFERHQTSVFTWLRGFRDMDARAVVNGAFYYGPVWKEHKPAVNPLMIDSDNVLLLRPLDANRGVTVLPAVDVVREGHTNRGVVIAQIFAVEDVEAFARDAEPIFASYRDAGVREAGVLATLDAPNNFPQHPIRTDGPFLVWLGIVEDAQAFTPSSSLVATETLFLHPTRRSRLRYI
jgi:hypothetical protein